MPIDSVSQIQSGLSALDPLSRAIAEEQIAQHIAGNPLNAGVVQQARDTYAAGADTAKGVDLRAQPGLGYQPSTASPHANYSHQAQQTAGTYFVPLSSDKVALTTSTGSNVISGSALGRVMNEKGSKWVGPGNPEGYRFATTRQGLIERNGLVQNAQGEWLAPVSRPAAGSAGDIIPGLTSGGAGMGAQGNIAQSSLDFLGRTSWMLPVGGFMSGGISGLVGGLITGNALKQTSGSMSGLSLSSGGMGSLGNLGGLNSLLSGGVGGGAGLGMLEGATGITTEGLRHNMQSLMQSQVREQKLNSMIGMIDNPGIPIEDLIFYFMAAMGDQMEEKLREKMKETAIAEKLEERRERRDKEAGMVSGMASGIGALFGPVGGMIGAGVGQAAQQGAMKMSQLEAGINGKTKSATMLMQEVQMLMHKWKQLNEMLSNLLKSMHDMAMTPIRNLR